MAQPTFLEVAQLTRVSDLPSMEDRMAGSQVGDNSQAHCMVCEFITRLQILREIFSADDSQCCPLHLLEVRGYVTRSVYGKKAMS